MRQLERLLNSLIKRGWKPFGKNSKGIKRLPNGVFSERTDETRFYLIRDIVSMESGLWQFVCDNEFINELGGYIYSEGLTDGEYYWNHTTYIYWILLSSTIEIKELEEFLLDNIKIEG